MKQLAKQLKLVFLSLFLCTLAACGGDEAGDPLENVSLSVDTDSLSFVQYQGETLADPRTIKVNYQGDGLLIGYAPGVAPVPWLSIESNKVDANNSEVVINLINNQFLAANQLSTTLRISTGDLEGLNLISHDIQIDLRIWQLDTEFAGLDFSAKFSEQETTTITMGIIAGEDGWQVSSTADWLSTDINEGAGEIDIAITADPSKISEWGLNQAELVFVDVISGDEKRLPITLAKDANRLWASQAAMAFASASDKQNLTQSLMVYHNHPDNISWQATSNVGWLTLTPDQANNRLQISADASNLTAGLHQAEISINSTGDLAAIGDTVTVSLYKQSNATTSVNIDLTGYNTRYLQFDPVFPYFYAFKANQLAVFHAYSGNKLVEITTPEVNGQIDSIVAHPQGQYVIVNVVPETPEENATRNKQYHFIPAQLAFTDEEPSIELARPLNYDPAAFVRFEGLDFVLSRAIEVANTDLDVQFWNPQAAYLFNLARQPGNQASLYLLNGQLALDRYIARVNQFENNTIALGQTHGLQFTNEFDSIIFDFFVADNEQDLYLGSTDTEWLSFDGLNFADNGRLNAEENVQTFDVAFHQQMPTFLRVDSELQFMLTSFNQQQQQISNQIVDIELATKLELSADGMRAALIGTNQETGSQTLTFVTLD